MRGWIRLHKGLPDGEGQRLNDCYALKYLLQFHLHKAIVFRLQVLILINAVDQVRNVLCDLVYLHLCLFLDDLDFLVEKINDFRCETLEVVKIVNVDSQLHRLSMLPIDRVVA